MKKRGAEKSKRQRERSKSANHLDNCEHGTQDIANSTRDAKDV